MTDERDPVTPAWLGAARPADRPRPDAGYRARAKHAFLTAGTRRASRLRSWWGGVAAPLAAAAAVVVAVALFNRTPGWHVMPGGTAPLVLVDGQGMPMSQVQGHLHAGAHVATPDGGTLELCARGRVFLTLMPGTEITLPRTPGRWFARSMRGEVAAGQLLVATGREFPGTQLDLDLGAARARVTGTAFAASRDSVGCCVCVVEGAVKMTPIRGESFMIPSGRHQIVRMDGGETRSEPLPDGEVRDLGAFRAHASEELAR